MRVLESKPVRVGELCLPAEPVCVGEARRHVAEVIRDWHVRVDEEIAILLTSEVFTNAVVHAAAPGDVIRLVEAWDGEQLRIEVHDSRSGELMWGDLTLDSTTEESGRGLGMVELLAAKWGVEATGYGKQVYFVLGADDDCAM
ncbi:MAG TPA: ATP-binding protein [Actinocrinis sp.]|nr:ATP-binding protein [Actinocrinis sp.]